MVATPDLIRRAKARKAKEKENATRLALQRSLELEAAIQAIAEASIVQISSGSLSQGVRALAVAALNAAWAVQDEIAND